MEHRDQGATRGQQQPSSLQSQPPPSLATPGRGRREQERSPSREREREREKEQEAGELEEEAKQKQAEEQKEEEDLTRGASTSLLPPRQELPAPTATRQLRAAFYSCTPAGNKNQYSSAVTARHLPSPSLPYLTLFPNSLLSHWNPHLAKLSQPMCDQTPRNGCHRHR